MFKKVMGTLFKPKPNQEKQIREINFTTSEPQSDDVSLLDDIVMSKHDVAFLNFLFGDSTQNTTQDPFSVYVCEQLERILVAPQSLLNELPIMPVSLTTILAELENKDFNVDVLLEVIESEASIAADVIKLANSSRYKRSEKQIIDLKAAFMNIGTQGLIEGVLESYIKKLTPSFNLYWRHYGENIWNHSLQTALFAKKLVLNTEMQDEQATAYFIGLIRNLGRMITFQIMVEAFKHVDPEATPNSSLFKRLIHGYEARVTLSVAQFWNLPKPVLVALSTQLYQESKRDELGAVVFEANYLSELSYVISEGILDRDEIIQLCKRNLTSKNAFQSAKQMLEEQKESAQN